MQGLDSDWPHRERSRFVCAGGVNWHIQRWGRTSRCVVLLHGTGASTHSWRKLAPLLAGAGHGVLSMDLPGHAHSRVLAPAVRSMAGQARALGELLASLRVRPTMVVGHSAGAALMLRAVLDGHLQAETLVGLNAALWPFEGLARWTFSPMARLMSSQPLVSGMLAWAARDPRSIQRLLDATGSRLDADDAGWYGRLMSRREHVDGVLGMMADWPLERLLADLPRLNQPLTLIVGDRDGTVPPAQADRVAALVARTRVRRLPGLGHLAHEEAPARVLSALPADAAAVSTRPSARA